ncbi:MULTISPECIES: TraB/GumN family protein [Niastella]|uniref:TraB/GumN family protein n=1 Tax=Niastella soli TaxID=2821487 RepID=A0ABS3YU86_9BACT|nr:TraB/GumN family protein [Niastella soli]MBO9201496.1 TraB/GumN family protein [Niastella soli]
MRKPISLLPVLLLVIFLPTLAQQPAHKPKAAPLPPHPTLVVPKPAPKKYPSLLWEISGNGLKRPSYLFGTMHVSDKLAFHLGDSFYTAIKSADVVALETNPESWQDDYSQSVFFRNNRRGSSLVNLYAANRWEWPTDHMRITTFAIDRYEEAIKAALAVEPSMINGMLYRTYGRQAEDFEEDTFLDMYIFQTGKKLGKRVSGVENFQESEKLVMEAYKAMLRDQNKKRRSYDYEGMMTNPKKVEDAYRKGDLDLLDSLESLTVFSDAFQEKFLYRRNEIQANSIDSIIQKMSLFVGVGAAHLPGKRGVIELLRQKGYIMRPVRMDDRNSLQKETVDKIRINSPFNTQTCDDGFYTVSIPGKKFYRFTDWNGLDVVQYADMVNGAYYMVTRIKTNSLSWGHSSDVVLKKIDSLLYENIPGKILKKTPITKNGYKGLDVVNRTRRGDNQHYQIFVTPFEVILFKMSGNGEYITSGNEAQEFFGSIHLKEYLAPGWQTWQPATGGFSVLTPHTPALLKDNSFGTDRLEYAAYDATTGNSYLIMKANLHNYSFIEEDSFELNLMDESYGYSDFIDKQLSHHFTTVNGYPALESKFKHKDGSYSSVKYVIQGPVYYAVIASYKNDNPNTQRFLQSFTITPYIYPAPTPRTDTTLYITVTSPVYNDPNKKSESAGMEELLQLTNGATDDDLDDYNMPSFATRLIGNDTIGEKILVMHFKVPPYAYRKDSTTIWKNASVSSWFNDSTFITKQNKVYRLPNGMQCRDIQLTDTNSSRLIIARLFYNNGHFFSISTLTDTLSKQSPLLANFFTSFKPIDSLKGESLFTRKNNRFMKDLFSKDSLAVKRARKSIYQVDFDSLDVPLLKMAIDSLNWKMKDYLVLKRYFIESLGKLKDSSITPYLQKLYWKVKDTADWQSAILNALLNQRTKTSFVAFRDLVLQEPPIMDEDYSYGRQPRLNSVYADFTGVPRNNKRSNYYGRWAPLFDTLSLTKNLFPDLLQLMNIDDYEEDVMNLLQTMVDSGYLKPVDYETSFPKLYLEAKQLLKKQLAKENKAKMEIAIRKESPTISTYASDDDDNENISDAGNAELDQYAILLLPFYNKNIGVQSFFEQLQTTQDRRLRYNTFILLLRNKYKVPDSLFLQYAKEDLYRSELYTDLETLNLLDKFPKQYKTQLEIAKSLVAKPLDNYEKLDTLIYLDKLPVAYENKKGYVYFFKYKRMRDDITWNVATVGMQPEKPDAIDTENDDFTSVEEGRKLDNDKPVKEQLQKMLKEMLYARRGSASVFYDARSYSLYRNYLSEMVKSQRYRD